MAKRAKKGKLKFVKTESEYSTYICPHCGVEVIGAGLSKIVTRFLCDKCHNEIIAER